MKEERVKEIYEEIGKLVIELSRDPMSLGPGYLQDLISKTRGFLNQTSYYLTEVLRERHHHEMELEALEAAFQVASDELMSGDRRVTSLPAIQDRTSMINVLLAKERKAILVERRILKDLGHVERVVRHRHKELENTMSAIRLQRSLIESELRTGATYGDESDQSRGSKWAKPSTGKPAVGDDMSEDDLDRLMQQAEEELETGTVEGPAKDPEEEVLAEVDSAGTTAPVADTSSDDIADLLEEAEQMGLGASEPEPAPEVAAKTSALPVTAPEPEPFAAVAAVPEAPVAGDVDPDIDRFLAQGGSPSGAEDDDSDLFGDL